MAKARLQSTGIGAKVRRRRFARGFTLIEIAVVLFIIGLVMTLAMPYLSTIQSARLRGQARELATRATYLYQASAAQKVILRLNLNLDNNSYYVTRLDPFAPKPAYVAETGPDGRRVTLPPGMRFRDVSVEGIGTFKHGVASCQFYPGGFADGTVIHMIDDRGDVYTLTINPLTGQVAARSGDYNPLRADRGAR